MIIRPKLPPYQRSKSINRITKKQKMISQTILKDLPSGTELLESQVAGHTFQIGTDEIGKFTLGALFGNKLASILYYSIFSGVNSVFWQFRCFKFGYNNSLFKKYSVFLRLMLIVFNILKIFSSI